MRMIVHQLRRPHSIFVQRTITQDSAYAAHAGHQIDVMLLIRVLHQLNDEAPGVIDLLSVVRPWRDPEVGILVVVPRRLEVEMQGHAWEFAASALYDPLGDLFDVLAFGHGYGLRAGFRPPRLPDSCSL